MTEIENMKELEVGGRWIEHWNGSPPQKGWWIASIDAHQTKELLFFIGTTEQDCIKTESLVRLHNAALLTSLASKGAEIERLKADLAKEEGAHSITVDQRDAAENCIGDVYFEITGRAPEWSNQFGYDDAFDEISARAEAAELLAIG